jgi:hypothetical protein
MLPVAATMALDTSGTKPPKTPLPMWYGSDSEV